MIMYCDWCGKAVETDMMPETSKHRALKRGYCYCSRECSVKGGHKRDVWTEERRKKASETMTKTNVKYHDQFVVLKMATLDAAQIFGIEKEVGSLVPGKRSDFIVFEDNGSDPFENFMNLMPEDYSMVIHKGNMIVGNDEFRRTSVDFSRYSEVKLNGATKLLFGRPVQLIERICNKLDKDIVFPFFDVLEED